MNAPGSPHLDIFRCTHCKLLFVGHVPNDRELQAAYDSEDTNAYYNDVREATSAKAVRALRDLEPVLAKSEDASVLDVGCGYGHFLIALLNEHPAARAAGAERPGASAEACRSQGLRVFTSDLHQIEEAFSIVVLLDVAEHLPFPSRTFKECSSLLRPGGHIYLHTPRACFWDEVSLVLVRVPVLSKLARVWLRSRVSIFHLQLWSDESLELALTQAGLNVVYLRKELGLSWPLERYIDIYLGGRRGVPRPMLTLATAIAHLLFVRLGALHNKAICLAEKHQGFGAGGA